MATFTFYTACAVCVIISSTGRKFRPVSIFTWLHALTLVTRSYVLLDETKGLHALTLAALSYVPLDEIKGLEMY